MVYILQGLIYINGVVNVNHLEQVVLTSQQWLIQHLNKQGRRVHSAP